MPELRWILLVLGLLFVGALAWWEMRRQRRLPQAPEEPTQHRFREPTLSLPEVRPREPAQSLPLVKIHDDSIDEDSMIGLRVDGMRIEEDLEPDVGTSAQTAEEEVSEPRRAAPRQTVQIPEPEPLREPVVDWPPEEQRKLIALRIAAPSGERFAGRALRLALTAGGFVLGKFDIFHKAGPDGRVLVSAASLNQPGTFALDTMDMQRYGGLGLFAVLPGPLPAPEMFDELLAAARVLNGRLEGALQDERGEPLTAMRATSLRDKLAAEQAAPEAQP